MLPKTRYSCLYTFLYVQKQLTNDMLKLFSDPFPV